MAHGLHKTGPAAETVSSPIVARRVSRRQRECVQSKTFLIVGYEPSPAALGGMGRLLLAALNGNALVYVGGVGTGFTHATGSALKKQLDELVIQNPAVAIKRKGAVWTQPILPAEVAFRGWTIEGKLRHSSYKGLREDADAGDICQIVSPID